MNLIRAHKLYQSDIEAIINSIPGRDLSGKRILVCGATGLLGTLLVDSLIYLNRKENSGIAVTAMGRSASKLKDRFDEYAQNGEISFMVQDIMEPFATNLCFDYIIDCAGNSHPAVFNSDPVGTLLGNIRGVENILNLAKNCNARVLYISSGEIYGQNRSDTPMAETYTGVLNLSTSRACYPEGKRASEALCQSYAAQYDVDVVIARPCRIFGPTMTAADNKASAQFIRKALARENIILKSDGTQKFPFIYGADAAAALLHILICGNTGEAYNVSSPLCETTLKDFAQTVANSQNLSVIFELSEEPGGSKVNNDLLDPSKLQALGWQSRFNLKDSIERTLHILSHHQL